jgi:hypothetical protein
MNRSKLPIKWLVMVTYSTYTVGQFSSRSIGPNVPSNDWLRWSKKLTRWVSIVQDEEEQMTHQKISYGDVRYLHGGSLKFWTNNRERAIKWFVTVTYSAYTVGQYSSRWIGAIYLSNGWLQWRTVSTRWVSLVLDEQEQKTHPMIGYGYVKNIHGESV